MFIVSNKISISVSSLIDIYKQLAQSSNVLRDYMNQDFFFTDNTRTKYDFKKVMIFNILYAGGSLQEKANFLFNVITNGE